MSENGQTAPHNLDMERSVLGSMLLEPSVVNPVVEVLAPEMFYHAAHQAIYSAMLELRNEEKVIDPAMVYDRLRTTGRLDEAGGHIMLMSLEQFVLSTSAAPDHAKQLVEYHRQRVILSIGQDVAARAMNYENPDTIAAHLASRMDTVTALAPRSDMHTGEDFLKLQLPPVEWLVEGLIPPGITVLVADPKVGKSRLATKIMGCVAGGSQLWGRNVAKGRVFYCDNDESEDEMQERLRETGLPNDAIQHFDITFNLPRLDQGGLGRIDRWVREHPDAKLIVMDTWAKVRPIPSARLDAYMADNESIRPLKEWSRKHPTIGILLIHHTSKAGKGDPILRGSGSQALAGSCACWMVMSRKASNQAVLHGTGRRLREFEFLLESRGIDWDCLGDAKDAAMSDSRHEILEALTIPMSPKEISSATGMSPESVRGLVRKMAKRATTPCRLGRVWKPNPRPPPRLARKKSGTRDDP